MQNTPNRTLLFLIVALLYVGQLSSQVRMRASSLDSARFLFEEQLQLVRTYRDKDAQRALIHADSAVYLASLIEEDSTLAKAYQYRSYALRGLARWAEARADLKEGFRLNVEKNAKATIRYFNNLANTYLGQGWNEKAIHYYLEGIKVAKSKGLLTELSGIYINLATLYSEMGNMTKALEVLYCTMHYLPPNSEDIQLYLHYNLAETHEQLNQEDSSAFYLKKITQEQPVEELPASWRSRIYNVSARLMAKKGAPWQAVEQSLGKAINVAKEAENPNLLFGISLSWGELLLEKGNLLRASKMLEQAHQVKGVELTPRDSVGWKQLMARLDSALGNWQSATTYMSEAMEIEQRIYESEDNEHIEVMRAEYLDAESKQLAAELKLLLQLKEDLVKQQRVNSYLLGLLLILVLLAGGVLYRLLRSRNRVNKGLKAQVEQQTDTITERNEQLRKYAYLNSSKLSYSLRTILHLLAEEHHLEGDRELLYKHLKEAGMEMDKIVREIDAQLYVKEEKAAQKREA